MVSVEIPIAKLFPLVKPIREAVTVPVREADSGTVIFERKAFDEKRVGILAFELIKRFDDERLFANTLVRPAKVGTEMFEVAMEDEASVGMIDALRDCTIKLLVVMLDAVVAVATTRLDVFKDDDASVGIMDVAKDCTTRLFVVRLEAVVAVATVRFEIDVVEEVRVEIAAVVAVSEVALRVEMVPEFVTVMFENVLEVPATSLTIVASVGTKRLDRVLLVAIICGVVMFEALIFEAVMVGTRRVVAIVTFEKLLFELVSIVIVALDKKLLLA